ncbi:MAG: sugar phosphate isomerase/epimerase [Lentisphaerae bacterium]|nr:sugar phosphate isomerase/epimerase [Lentisphaerota bacterium]
MANIISCRTGVFGALPDAFATLAAAGVRYAEVPRPADGDYQAMADLAAAHGITIMTIAGPLKLDTDETMQAYLPVIDGARSIGVAKLFFSAGSGPDVPRVVALERLRTVVRYAESRGITLCLETHPPFGVNADVARQTIEAIGSDSLRWNYDTANIYYYNEGLDGLTELKKIAPLVGAVHLKDTDGRFKGPIFPVFGTGIVDFPGVFRHLGDLGFEGPYTLEIEGENVAKLDQAGRKDFLHQCLAALRRFGAMA